jgi:hypothetical protein
LLLNPLYISYELGRRFFGAELVTKDNDYHKAAGIYVPAYNQALRPIIAASLI